MSAGFSDDFFVNVTCPDCGRAAHCSRSVLEVGCKCVCGSKCEEVHGTLRPPRLLVFAIVTPEGIEERRFSILSGMPEPQEGNEVRLPLAESDPITALPEWKECGGWVFVSKRALDYVAGHVWLQAHFLDAETRVLRGE